jgi:hypothetical protein
VGAVGTEFRCAALNLRREELHCQWRIIGHRLRSSSSDSIHYRLS